MQKEDLNNILEVIEQYFQGIYQGDIDMLQRVFHPQTFLFGDINGKPYQKTVKEYLEGVQNRKSPKELGEAFRMKTLSVEVLNGIAYARLISPMFEFKYHDYLAFNKIDGKWVIVNKIFTNVNV